MNRGKGEGDKTRKWKLKVRSGTRVKNTEGRGGIGRDREERKGGTERGRGRRKLTSFRAARIFMSKSVGSILSL